jgi:dihydroorotate dehydrogenase
VERRKTAVPSKEGRMTTLKNGVTFKPIMLDCVLGHSGSGIWQYKLVSPAYRRLIKTVIETETPVGAKSATEPGRIGNYREYNPYTWFKCARRIEHNTGIHNTFGLTNRGVLPCAEEILKSIQNGIDVKPNLYIDYSRGMDAARKNTQRALDIYEMVLGEQFRCLIKNGSCPNSGEDITEIIEYNTAMTRWIKDYKKGKVAVLDKVSVVHPFEMLEELEKQGADGIIGINTIPFNLVYPNKKSPTWKWGGGAISGAPAFKQAYDYNKEAIKHVSIPYFMGCGVTCEDDVLAYFDIGADVVVICSWAALYPGEVIDIIEEFNL